MNRVYVCCAIFDKNKRDKRSYSDALEATKPSCHPWCLTEHACGILNTLAARRSSMVSRLAIGMGFAVAALISILVNTLNSVAGLYFLPLSVQTVGILFGLIGVLLSIGAFVVSWGYKSEPISGLLIAAGAIFAIGALIATGFLTTIIFPGPIIGIVLGLLVVGLGIARGIGQKIPITANHPV